MSVRSGVDNAPICPQHNMPWVGVCGEAECSERRMGCAACIARGTHKGHAVEKLTNALDRHDKEREQMAEEAKKFAGQAAAVKELARSRRAGLAMTQTSITATIANHFDDLRKQLDNMERSMIARVAGMTQSVVTSLDAFTVGLESEANNLAAAAAKIEANEEQLGALVLAKSGKLVEEGKMTLAKATKAVMLPQAHIGLIERIIPMPLLDVRVTPAPDNGLLNSSTALGISSIIDNVAKVGANTSGIVMSRGFKDTRCRFEFALQPPSGAPADAACNVGIGVTSMATQDAQLFNSEQTIVWRADKITSGKMEKKLSTPAKFVADKICAIEYDPQSGTFSTFVDDVQTGIQFQHVIRGSPLRFVFTGDAGWTLICVLRLPKRQRLLTKAPPTS
ncbi:uncharacterized protein AMSG_07098 [Thecamonas trahens ATCC 50062]|uniref:Uncharacterized protein n=1 Tax=Thecamonas trahens ATCC 50062 TaxID=461836 RepID=A0A0L0DFE5_THETB|nr:hypothetical protein AMSG_07098 [Thecamonas trahens ATCC 50062]KNC50866.1 hypothetical protein AMSG_07098 [Thecamonas trahens ATCC 50062]|eukprot:XP_013756574.1 hypothetical protein AMSG_07098 [Thecamonas trahens ATCC 50062]